MAVAKPGQGQGMDAFGAFSYLVYIAVGGFLVFGFAWSIRGAVDVQNEAVCRALHPEHRNRVRGSVLDAQGGPVAGAAVIPVIDGDPRTAVEVTADGAFEAFLPEGEHVLRIEAPGQAPLDAPITVGRKETVDVEIAMAPEGSDAGAMVEQGRTGFEAPEIALQDLAGNEVHLSDFRGKFVVLNFWATWCEPCITEWPQIHQLAGRLGERDDVVVLAVSVDEKPEVIAPFLGRMGLARQDEESKQWELETPVTVLWDPEDTARRKFGTQQIPDTYFVNEAGEVLHTYVNVRKWGSPEAFHCVDGTIGL